MAASPHRLRTTLRRPSRPTPAPARASLWERAKGLGAAVKSWTLYLSLLAALLGCGAILVDAWPTSFMITPVAVPATLQARGLSPAVMAARLKTALAEINRVATTGSGRIGHAASPAEQSDFQLPGQQVSARSVVGFIKKLLGRPDVDVTIDITEDRDGYQAELRSSDQDDMTTLHFALGSPATEMVEKLALSIMQRTKPLVHASYRFDRLAASCPKDGGCSYQEVLDLYAAMLRRPRAPDDAWAEQGLCTAYAQMGQFANARDACRAALLRNPRFARTHLRLGLLAEQADPPQWQRAVDEYAQALQLDAHDVQTHLYLGDALVKLNRPDEAFKQYMLLGAAPTQTDAERRRKSQALISAAQLLLKRGAIDQALAQFRRAAELAPEQLSSFTDWGDALVQLKRYEEAARIFKRAAMLSPDDEQVYFRLAYVADVQNDIDHALSYYRLAARCNPQNRKAPVRISELLAEQGRYDLAVAELVAAARADGPVVQAEPQAQADLTERLGQQCQAWRQAIAAPASASLPPAARLLAKQCTETASKRAAAPQPPSA